MSRRDQLPRWGLPLGVFLLALALRTVDLADNPPGFFRDEAEKGYTSWTLMHAGTDIAGRPWPLFVQSFSVFTSSVYQYADIPFIAALGLTEFAVRLPAALAGSLAVLFAFLLMRRLFDWRTGLAAALILAFSPWHLLFSRWANQGIFLPLGILAGCYCLAGLADSTKRVPKGLWGAGVVLAWTLALYSYAPAKVLVPVLLLVALGVFLFRRRPDGSPPGILAPALILGLVFALALPMLTFQMSQSEQAQARFEAISVFHDDASAPVAAGRSAVNLARHLSPVFLFATGDANPRHNFGGVGVYLALDALLLLAALIETVRTRNRYLVFLWIWFVLGFVPASLTIEGIPHALRSIGGLAAGCLLAGRGAVWLLDAVRKSERVSKGSRRAVIGVFCLLYVGVIGGFLWGAFVEYPGQARVRMAWQAGWGETVARFEEQQQRNGWPEMERLHVLWNARAAFPHIFFLFYGEVDPAQGFDWDTGVPAWTPLEPGEVVLFVEADRPGVEEYVLYQEGIEMATIREELTGATYKVAVKVE